MSSTILVPLIPFLLLFLVIADDNLQKILSKFHQNEYVIKIERLETRSFNPKYFTNFKAASFKYNRTSFAINVTYTYKVDVGYDIQVVVQLHKFLSNEYRYFPLRVQLPFCDVFEHHVVGLGMFPCGNFTGCPGIKGKTEHICNWNIDYSSLPPGVPSGRYLTVLNASYHSDLLLVVHTYYEIMRPIKYK